MLNAEQRGQLALEGVDLRAHDEALAVRDASNGGKNLLAERAILGLEVEERHPHPVTSVLPSRFDCRPRLAIRLASFDRFAFVVLLLASRQADRDLHAAVFVIEADR